jgi:hypothetical protein
LAKRTFHVIAMMDAYENAVIQLDDGAFGYVHLPWKAESPHYEAIGGEVELVRFLQGGASDPSSRASRSSAW